MIRGSCSYCRFPRVRLRLNGLYACDECYRRLLP